MSQLFSDLRSGLRQLLGSPLTTGAAILSLALGIGGTTAIFSVVDAVLLRPLPFAEPDRLVLVWSASKFDRGDHSPADFLDYRREARTFDGMAAVMSTSMSLTGDGEPEQLRVQSVSGTFFPLLGVKAMAGRTFVAADDGPEERGAVMLSEGLWKRRYGGRADAIGRVITLSDRRVEIVGIVPETFRFDVPADAWLLGRRGVPHASNMLGDLTTNRDVHIVTVVGRLRQGVTIAAAQSDLEAIAARLARDYPAYNTGRSVALEPLASALVGDTSTVLFALLGAVTLLLLIASVNVANLLLVRSEGRTLELAMRTALGASRGRLASQILVESLVLAALGGLAGGLLALLGTDALLRLAPADLPRFEEVAIDMRVLAFASLLTLVVGVAFGCWPAWRASRQTIGATLNTVARGSIGRDRRRAQQLLVAGELSLALLLLVGAGLLVSSFARLLSTPPGYDPRGIVAADVALPGDRYANPARKARFHADVLEQLRSAPGIAGAAMGLTAPIASGMSRGVWIDGQPDPGPGRRPSMGFLTISENYFQLLGIPLRRGRAFTARDDAGAPTVVIVNEAFARRHFPGEDAVGKRIGFGDPRYAKYWRTIVAVAADTRRLSDPPRPTAYIPFQQNTEPWSTGVFFVKTSLPTAVAGDAIRRAVLTADGDQPISRVRTLDEALYRSVSTQRFTTIVSTSFAALALLLAAVGTFGVMSHIVGTRTRELGVRMALGATRGDIVRLVLGQTSRIVAAAMAAGLGAAWLLGGAMQSLLFEVKPGDPTTFTVAAFGLASVALIAGYIPVRRALARNPLTSLKNE
jgi:putative ABC transport system permease protein